MSFSHKHSGLVFFFFPSVTEKTGHVVVSAKSGVKAKKRAEQPDFTKLSALQGKRAEMEIQVSRSVAIFVVTGAVC